MINFDHLDRVSSILVAAPAWARTGVLVNTVALRTASSSAEVLNMIDFQTVAKWRFILSQFLD